MTRPYNNQVWLSYLEKNAGFNLNRSLGNDCIPKFLITQKLFIMKKIIPVVMLSGIVASSACGNKTANNDTQQDSVQAADTTATDTTVTAEPAETAQEATDAPAAKSIEAGGTTITVGAPLAETLKKAKGARFEYNADFGVAVVVGNVMIRIPDEDITKEGQDFVNAIPSDMDPDIAFKVSFIKPSAKIKDFEKI